MGSPDLIALLGETTAASSAAVLLALLSRRPLRAGFGAVVGYAAWLLVPAAIVAVLLPAMLAAPAPASTLVVSVAVPTTLHHAAGGFDVERWLCMAWVSGALGMAWRFSQQQRAFRLGLGGLRRRADGLLQATSVAGLPAAIGLWRPMVIVPADFDSRYTLAQQRLMHEHELRHIRCGDLQINALVTALRCVFWFNPLLQVAARYFRQDQELACDQRVIACHPHSRRAYGEAMFKSQLAAQPLPLGCHWAAALQTARHHPLKERIAMLKQPVVSLSRWIVGSAVVGILTVGGGVAAWAAQPARHASGGGRHQDGARRICRFRHRTFRKAITAGAIDSLLHCERRGTYCGAEISGKRTGQPHRRKRAAGH